MSKIIMNCDFIKIIANVGVITEIANYDTIKIIAKCDIIKIIANFDVIGTNSGFSEIKIDLCVRFHSAFLHCVFLSIRFRNPTRVKIKLSWIFIGQGVLTLIMLPLIRINQLTVSVTRGHHGSQIYVSTFI
jgi:hypothetical protein